MTLISMLMVARRHDRENGSRVKFSADERVEDLEVLNPACSTFGTYFAGLASQANAAAASRTSKVGGHHQDLEL
jgi:hypothetical protein